MIPVPRELLELTGQVKARRIIIPAFDTFVLESNPDRWLLLYELSGAGSPSAHPNVFADLSVNPPDFSQLNGLPITTINHGILPTLSWRFVDDGGMDFDVYLIESVTTGVSMGELLRRFNAQRNQTSPICGRNFVSDFPTPQRAASRIASDVIRSIRTAAGCRDSGGTKPRR